MKKKLLLSIVSSLFFGFSSLALVSCGDIPILQPSTEPSEQPHVHEWNDGEITKEATCTTNGEKTYTCNGCDEIKVESITATGHIEVIDPAVSPTCTETGLTEGKHCSVCNEVLVVQEVVAAKGHTEVIDAAVGATCTETGLTEGKHCSVCEEVLVAQEEVAAKGHTEVVDAAVAATCTETGLTEGQHCSACNEVLVAQEVIEMTNHNYVDYVCDVCGYNFYTEGLLFTLSNDGKEYKVSYYNGTETNVIIPSVYDDKPVTSIGECAFSSCTSLINIRIPDSIIVIEDWAFNNCESLTSITIPDSVTSIGVDAFSYCSSLTDASIGNGITNISVDLFADCGSLTSIVVPDSVTSIGEVAFAFCGSLTSIVIPDSVTNIGNGAFAGCSLTTVHYTGTEEQWNNITKGEGVFDTPPTIDYNCLCVHTEVIDVAVAATCTESGLTEGKHCSTCNEVLVAQEEVAALGHTEVIDVAVEATYTETGLTEGKHCSVCEELLIEQEIVPIKTLNSLMGFDELEDGTLVTDIRAVITYIHGKNYMFVQDENGINCHIYKYNNDAIQVGDTVIISGTKMTFAGHPEIMNVEIEIITGDLQLDLVSPIEVTTENINEIMTVANNYATFKLVRATVVEIGTRYSKLLIGDTEITTYNAVFPEDIVVGDVIDMTCVMWCYNDEIQFRNSNADEVTKY